MAMRRARLEWTSLARTAKLWLSVQFLPDQNWSIIWLNQGREIPLTHQPTNQLTDQNSSSSTKTKDSPPTQTKQTKSSALAQLAAPSSLDMPCTSSSSACRSTSTCGLSWVGLHDADGEMFLSTRISRFIRLHYVHIDTAHIRSI